MKRMRQNQNAAMGSVRAQRGGSGFTSEGSGSQAEGAVADVWESAIGDAALSNAVSDANKRFAAESARYQGDLAMMAARSEADQYKMLSQNALGSAMIQTALTAAGGVMGAAGMSGGGLLGGVTESGDEWGAKVGGTQGAFSGMMNVYSLSGSLGGMVPGSMQSSNRLRDFLLANFMGFSHAAGFFSDGSPAPRLVPGDRFPGGRGRRDRVVLPFVVFCGGAGSGVSQDIDCSFCPRPHGGRQGAGLSGAGAF